MFASSGFPPWGRGYDAELVNEVAAEHVGWRGAGALCYLRERQDLAKQAGDLMSADAWRDIAVAASCLLARPGMQESAPLASTRRYLIRSEQILDESRCRLVTV